MSIGETLAAARETAGLSVEEVAAATRIRRTLIQAIEDDDFSACGGDFYARGHIRTIAAAVGLDPAPLLAEFDAGHGRRPRRPAPPRSSSPRPRPGPRAPRGPNWSAAMAAALVLVIAYGVVQAFSGSGGGGHDVAGPGRQPPARRRRTSAAARRRRRPATTARCAQAPRGKVTVVVRGHRRAAGCRSPRRSGQELFQGLLQRGPARRPSPTRPGVKLVIGNAGGVDADRQRQRHRCSRAPRAGRPACSSRPRTPLARLTGGSAARIGCGPMPHRCPTRPARRAGHPRLRPQRGRLRGARRPARRRRLGAGRRRRRRRRGAGQHLRLRRGRQEGLGRHPARGGRPQGRRPDQGGGRRRLPGRAVRRRARRGAARGRRGARLRRLRATSPPGSRDPRRRGARAARRRGTAARCCRSRPVDRAARRPRARTCPARTCRPGVAPASGPRPLRRRLDDGPVAPLKLASGCDRRCTFCAIPSFRGCVRLPPPARGAGRGALAGRPGRARAGAGQRELHLVRQGPRRPAAARDAAARAGRASTASTRVRVSYLQPAEMRPGLVEVDHLHARRRCPTSTCPSSTPARRCCAGCAGSATPSASSSCSTTVRAAAPEAGHPVQRHRRLPRRDRGRPGRARAVPHRGAARRVGVFGYSDEDGTEAATLRRQARRGRRRGAGRAGHRPGRRADRPARRGAGRRDRVEVLVEEVDALAGTAEGRGRAPGARGRRHAPRCWRRPGLASGRATMVTAVGRRQPTASTWSRGADVTSR